MRLFFQLASFIGKLAAVLLLSISQNGLAAERVDSTPIVVQLETETVRLPLYLSKAASSQAGFDPAYCTQIEQVLSFDLDHNGMTAVLKQTPASEKMVNGENFDFPLKASDWKGLQAFYLVKLQIKDKKLSARLFAANADWVKSIDGIPLSGNLSSDRQRIHQVADTIHKTLFGTDGVAATRFLYTLKTQQGAKQSSEVWEADYDGKNARQLTVDGGYIVMPVYAPPKAGRASGSFFFVSYKTGQPKIYYQSLTDKTPPRRLTYLRGNQLMPALSYQQDKLAFISDVTGNPDLFIQPFSPEEGAIGKPYQAFATHRATQGTPTFSPDGSKIAFVSNKDGSARIYMMSVPKAGTSLKTIRAELVTKHNKESTAPSWSPDGTKIAYCSITNRVRQIWMYDLVKREERQLTDGPGNKENPTWAPNSLHLMFNSTGANSCEIYLINLNQKEAVRISSGQGEKHFPCWEPRISAK